MLKHFLVYILVHLVRLPILAQEPQAWHAALWNIKEGGSPVVFEADYFVREIYPFNEAPQLLIKWKNTHYVSIMGSGRVYRLSEEDRTHFERVDTTRHYGYNIGSFNFSYRDSLYSLGGYGFWRTNGQLRVFVEKTLQWDILKLNREIPLLWDHKRSILWFDEANGKVYLGYSFNRNEAILSGTEPESNIDFSVNELDLNLRQWKKVGTLSKLLRERLNLFEHLCNTPFGQLAVIGNRFTIIDFSRNQIRYFKDSKAKEIVQSLAPHILSRRFIFSDSTLYALNPNSNQVDSFIIHDSDLLSTDDKVFSSNTIHIANYAKMAGILFFCIACFALWRYGFKKQKRNRSLKVSTNQTSEKPDEDIPSIQILQPNEIQLVQSILNDSLKGKLTEIEIINKTLGISKRGNDHQKKMRSDTITSINRKLNYLLQNSEPVIAKVRNDMDRRAFDYFIPSKYLASVSKILEQKLE